MIRVAAGVLAAALLTLSFSAPASAQGLFERIFGGLRHAVDAPTRQSSNSNAFVDPFTSLANHFNPPQQQMRVESGPSRAFCVRSCDGRYFPVQAHAGVTAAESCNSFCPASQTRLYSGSNIDTAVANDGSRYADMDNAFVYRKQLVAGCTCNGRDAFGLARVDVNTDATLRPGDVVASKTGLMAFTGAKNLGAKNLGAKNLGAKNLGARNKVADFTPIDSYRGLNQSARDKLSDIKIMPPTPALPETTASITPADKARSNDRRRVQLSR